MGDFDDPLALIDDEGKSYFCRLENGFFKLNNDKDGWKFNVH
jgi:hypothetical protein